MSDEEFLGKRRQALEDSFFAKENRRLLERLRKEESKKQAKESLAEISGLRDEAVLDRLAELEIKSSTWAALSLVPLVEVAWADGTLDEREKRAVLSAAEASGVAKGTPSFELLERWLAERPPAELLSGWGEYIVTLCAELGPKERQALKREVLERARHVAEATGGILGLTQKVSAKEAALLTRLAKVFGD